MQFFYPPSKMCLPRAVRVLDPEALPFEIQQGWIAPVDVEEGFMLMDQFEEDEEYAFIPFAMEEEDEFGPLAPWSDNDTIVADDHYRLDDIEEFGLLGLEEEGTERMWNVYGGYERPRDADDWRACWEFCTQALQFVTGLTYEFEEWQAAQFQ